eukprot:118837-Chlamydomonas_euryale.AAC.7
MEPPPWMSREPARRLFVRVVFSLKNSLPCDGVSGITPLRALAHLERDACLHRHQAFAHVQREHPVQPRRVDDHRHGCAVRAIRAAQVVVAKEAGRRGAQQVVAPCGALVTVKAAHQVSDLVGALGNVHVLRLAGAPAKRAWERDRARPLARLRRTRGHTRCDVGVCWDAAARLPATHTDARPPETPADATAAGCVSVLGRGRKFVCDTHGRPPA